MGNKVHPLVIVRAWGDEPVKMYLESIENNVCYVGSGVSGRTIGLPSDQVFAFDNALYSSLHATFREGDRDRLSTLYTQLSVDDLACNKYQDWVPSLHDQEDITGIECIAGGYGR